MEWTLPDTSALAHPRNRILASLSQGDYGLLERYLEPVRLRVRRRLEARNRRIDAIFFLESGIASVLVGADGRKGIEVGLIGHEGMTGLAVILGANRTPHETFMQIAGTAQCITTPHLHECLEQSASLRLALTRYAHVFMIQNAFTAVSSGRNNIEERLARWLLMADDRIDGGELPLTHEFLAVMLGVRRPGVTVALNRLENEGLIRAKRGVISLLERKGLEDLTGGTYGAPEAEFRRLFN